MDELDIHSCWTSRINNYKLYIEFKFWLPKPIDFVESRAWEAQNIFSFSIRLGKVIIGEQ